MRRYKKVTSLIHTFRQLDRTDVRLLVAGNPYTEKLGRQEAAQDYRVMTALDLIRKTGFECIFGRWTSPFCRMKSFSIREAHCLALWFDTPAIAAKNSSMIDLQERIAANWVHLFREILTSKDLEGAIEWAFDVRSRRTLLDGTDWPSIPHRICGFYQRL